MSEAYTCSPKSPAKSRAFCTRTLRTLLGRRPGFESVIADAEIIVSELVTNAVNAECAAAELTVKVRDDCVRIEVCDDAGGTPVLCSPGLAEGHGRGLMIVAALAGEWGVDRLNAGKRVWAELPLALPGLAGRC